VIDEREIVRRVAQRLAPPEPSFERMLRRRDRKLRNQRIAAGVIGITVFVGMVALSAIPSFERGDQPVAPGPSVFHPYPDQAAQGLPRLPPEGAQPSSPERGELVTTYYGRPSFGVLQVMVFADGRVIWREESIPAGANGSNAGFLEQRLTPEGVALLRSEVISSGLFDRDHNFDAGINVPGGDEHGLIWGVIRVDDGDRTVSVGWGPISGTPASSTTLGQAAALKRLNDLFSDLASALPANAWVDPEIKAYVPSSYAICYAQGGFSGPLEPSEVLNLLPKLAEDLLLGRDTRYKPYYAINGGGRRRDVCSEVTTEEARLLEGIFVDAGVQRHQPTTSTTGALEYTILVPYQTRPVYVRFEPILPHGHWSLFPG
jgi:hypothetical protein